MFGFGLQFQTTCQALLQLVGSNTNLWYLLRLGKEGELESASGTQVHDKTEEISYSCK